MVKVNVQLPVVRASSNSKLHDPMGIGNPGRMLKNPRVLLMIACLWPLAVLALFLSSSPGQQQDPLPPSVALSSQKREKKRNLISGVKIRDILDRVDIMGYGPTHPRAAFVVVGDDRNSLIQSIESIFSSTDMKRIFVIVAVLEGHENDSKLVKKLHKIEKGSVPHWHGSRSEVHLKGGDRKKLGDDEDEEDEDEEENSRHSPKIHVLFNPSRRGLTASRSRATQFIQILNDKHESAGMKSPDEDLILLLLQGGTKFKDHNWLKEVTPALIVPAPFLSFRKLDTPPMKLANAISFHVEGTAKRTSFDQHFKPIISDPTASDMNQSSGRSFRTPALNGAAVAMRLNTYLNLPILSDNPFVDHWPANLDLALNLWLCADGIDIIDDLEVTPPSTDIYSKNNSLLREIVAYFTAIYMDDAFRQKFFQAVYPSDTNLIREAEVNRIRTNHALFKRCRSFEWYIEEVNTDISNVLDAIRDIKDYKEKAPVVEEIKKEGAHIVDAIHDIKGHKEAPVVEEITKEDVHIEPPPVMEETIKKEDAHIEPPGVKPSTPLRPFNLEIAQKPDMIDVSFVDVSDGHKEHPHLGALDSNLVSGYVHDETALRKNPPPFTFDEAEMKAGCTKRDGNYKMMKKRIVVETDYDKKMESSVQKRDKIFCLVYTIEQGHTKIPNIRETWGPKCDGFMVGSNKTDASIGAVNIPHEGPEEYNNIWQKVRSMWSYIYDNYYEKYDWFHIGGDDLFLLVENLRYYLESEEIRTAQNGGIYLPPNDDNGTTKNNRKQTPLFLGRRFAYQGDMNDIFNSGGSGYTMNKAALKLIVTEGFPNYFPHRKTFSEDTMVAKLFSKMNVFPYDTKDDEGGERYMPFLPGHHFSYRLPSDPSKDWYAKYSINIKEGLEHCSPNSVAFHYVKGNMMKRLFALAYDLCPKT